MSGEEQAALASEIRAQVEAELQRRGKFGTLRVEGEELVIKHGNLETRAELRGTLVQWEHLPDDLRERRVQQIAGLLATEPVAPAGVPARRAPVSARREGLSWTTIFAPLAILALTGGAIAAAYHFLAPAGGFKGFPRSPSNASSAGSANPAADSERERFLFASSACDHTRVRVAQGANIGPADSEGWVVELVLLRHGPGVDLTALPELGKFITRKPGAHTGTVIWAPAKELVNAQRFDAEVSLSALPPLGAEQTSGLDLVFSGPYVLPYFTETERADYFRLADALADELHASAGGMFARCAHGEARQIGSWFLGGSPGEALGSLVYFMATRTDTPLLKPSVLGTETGAAQATHAFDAINAASASTDRNTTATLIGRELGMISGGKGQLTRLTFPFRDANRATRAGLAAARALKLANSG